MTKYIRPSKEHEENDVVEDDYWDNGKKKRERKEKSVWIRGGQ